MSFQPMKTWYRVHPATEDPERLLDPDQQKSEPWGGTVYGRCDKCDGAGTTEHEHGDEGECPACRGSGEIDDSERDGVSVFPDVVNLYRYMVKRNADLSESSIVKLAGEESPDRDFDADEGAVLVKPREILEVGPVDVDRIERIRRELGNR